MENDGKIKFLVLVELAEVVQLTDPRDKPMPDIRVRQIITNSGKKGLKKSDGFETVPTFISKSNVWSWTWVTYPPGILTPT